MAQEAVSNAADIKKRVDQLKKDGKKSVLLLVANGDGELRFVALSVQWGRWSPSYRGQCQRVRLGAGPDDRLRMNPEYQSLQPHAGPGQAGAKAAQSRRYVDGDLTRNPTLFSTFQLQYLAMGFIIRHVCLIWRAHAVNGEALQTVPHIPALMLMSHSWR